MGDPGEALTAGLPARGTVMPPASTEAGAAVEESVRTLCLPRTPESAGRARLMVSGALTGWGLESLEYAAGLVVTELVTNAIRHARMDTVRVSVMRLGPRRVRVAVVDRSPKLPVLRDAGPQEENGRGLGIVANLCSGRWGVDPLRWGKRVWGDLDDDEEAAPTGRLGRRAGTRNAVAPPANSRAGRRR